MCLLEPMSFFKTESKSVLVLFYMGVYRRLGFLSGAGGKEPACQCRRPETAVPSLGWEDPLEEGMATSSSVLAWRIPQSEDRRMRPHFAKILTS